MISRKKYDDVFQRADSDKYVGLGFALFVVRGCNMWRREDLLLNLAL